MLNVIVLDLLKNETTSITGILKTAFEQRELPIKRLAFVSEHQSILGIDIKKLSAYNVFIASMDHVKEEYIEFMKALRCASEGIFIVFVLSKDADIGLCVRPSVRPSGILFIPLNKARVYQTIHEIYVEHQRIVSHLKQPVFTFKRGGNYYSVNTGDISFFEARGKKIALKTNGQEIEFYSNFDTVLEQLPDWFVRCHKGFVINTTKIIQANLTEMTLILKDQCRIPISRTYRNDIKSLVRLKEVKV